MYFRYSFQIQILSLEEEASFEAGAGGSGDTVVDHVGRELLHARTQLRTDRHRRVPDVRAGARRAHRNPTSREFPRRTDKEFAKAKSEAKI